jgi:hypothetical protein
MPHVRAPILAVALIWAGPEDPVPANSSLFLFISTRDDFSPEDIQCSVAGIPGNHVELFAISYARPEATPGDLTRLGAPAWESIAPPRHSHERVFLWTPTWELPVGQASVQFGTRRANDWSWRAARPSLEPDGATTVVEADHLAPEIPTVTLGIPTTKGEMTPLGAENRAADGRPTGAAPSRRDGAAPVGPVACHRGG